MDHRELDQLLGRLRRRSATAPDDLPEAVLARIASSSEPLPSTAAILATACVAAALVATAVSHEVAARSVADRPPELHLFSSGFSPVRTP